VPENNNLGELERGDEINSALYINMSSDRGEVYQIPFEPRVIEADYEAVKDDIDGQRISNQDVTEWVDISSKVVINGQSPQEYGIEENRQIEADGKIDYSINIPENADPGQHYFTIKPNPESENGGLSTDLSYRPVIFDVSGDVERSLELHSVEAYNKQKDEVKIDFAIRNTGNVAVKTERSTIEILDESGNIIEGLTFPESRIPSGESKEISISWNPVKEVEDSDYRLQGSIDYYTSSVHLSEDLEIMDGRIQKNSNINKSNSSNLTGQFFSSVNSTTYVLLIGIIGISVYLYYLQ
jgi:hypothetical protein